jgi:outer membrane receptor protein involved in Fe transport
MATVIRIMLWLLILHTADAVAQESKEEEEALLQIYGDEEMISIATGSRRPIAKAPAVATVLTAEDIKAMGATDLDEVLETVPGLHVARSPLGYDPIYIFRGIFSDFNAQVLVLINSIPITNLFHGDRNQVWGGMPVEAIARIEVIRGPGSALYGADAFAGVINIITKTKQDIEGTEVGFRPGSFDTWDTWALHGGTWGGFDVAAILEYHDTDGQQEIIDADAQTAFDRVFVTSASLAPGPVNLQRENFDARLDIARGDWRLRAGLQRRRDGGNGAGVAQALDPNNRFASDRWNVDLTYHNPEFAEDWNVAAQLSYFDTSQEIERDLRLFPPGTLLRIDSNGNINFVNPVGLISFPEGFIGNPEVFERHARFNISAFFKGFERHVLRGGTGFNYGNLYKTRETKNFGPSVIDGTVSPIGGALTDVSDTLFVFLRERDRKNYYLFLQDEWRFANDWELIAGVRYDYYSDFGDTINPRFALVWQTRYDLTTKLLYGRAFRAPSFAELGNINNPVTVGNPNLDPETIQTLELAFDYRPVDKLRLGLNLFGYQWDDIIRFVLPQAKNTGEQTGYGLELEADWWPTRTLRLLGNYSYQRSIDEATDHDAGNAPHHQVYLRADWEFLPDWHFNPQLNWIIDRDRVAGDNRPDIGDYSLVDLTVRRKNLKDHWEIAFAVRNLFDSDAREPSQAMPAREPGQAMPALIPDDLPLAGRSFFGEIRFRF